MCEPYEVFIGQFLETSSHNPDLQVSGVTLFRQYCRKPESTVHKCTTVEPSSKTLQGEGCLKQ